MRLQMRTEIAKLHSRLATTMIYVTHDQVEAMTMGDRICLMKDGRIQQVAEPLEIYNYPANMFVAAFIGSPAMNFCQGTLVEKGGRLHFSAMKNHESDDSIFLPVESDHEGKLAPWINKTLVFGIRPEDLEDRTAVSNFQSRPRFQRETRGGRNPGRRNLFLSYNRNAHVDRPLRQPGAAKKPAGKSTSWPT